MKILFEREKSCLDISDFLCCIYLVKKSYHKLLGRRRREQADFKLFCARSHKGSPTNDVNFGDKKGTNSLEGADQKVQIVLIEEGSWQQRYK